MRIRSTAPKMGKWNYTFNSNVKLKIHNTIQYTIVNEQQRIVEAVE